MKPSTFFNKTKSIQIFQLIDNVRFYGKIIFLVVKLTKCNNGVGKNNKQLPIFVTTCKYLNFNYNLLTYCINT